MGSKPCAMVFGLIESFGPCCLVLLGNALVQFGAVHEPGVVPIDSIDKAALR